MTTLLTIIAYAAFAVAFISGLVAVWTWPSQTASGPDAGEGRRAACSFSHPAFDIEVTR